MSSTKRKSSTRDPFDYYPTPEWCVTRLLEKAGIPFKGNPVWVEPSAGSGAIISAVGKYHKIKKNGITSVLQYKPSWIAVEIQPRLEIELQKQINKKFILITDFLSLEADAFGVAPQVIITNPPFNKALEFIKKSFEFKAEYVCMLLRLNFLGSHTRSDFIREHTPDIYVLPNRPSFTDGKTDSIEYAWFVWRRDNNYGAPLANGSSPGKIQILEDTPASERSSSNKEEKKDSNDSIDDNQNNVHKGSSN